MIQEEKDKDTLLNKKVKLESMQILLMLNIKRQVKVSIQMHMAAEMQERAFDYKDYQYILLKSPPASGKSRALMFLALDKLKIKELKKLLLLFQSDLLEVRLHLLI